MNQHARVITRPTPQAVRHQAGAARGANICRVWFTDRMMLEIWDEHNGDRCHIHVKGELDISSTPVLRSHLRAVLERRGTREIVVHLGQAGYLDSTAVGALMEALRRARENGRELLLAGVEHGPARTMMDLAPLLNVFPIWDDN